MPTDNNSFATATAITNLIGTPPFTGLLNASDKTDFYKLTLNGSSNISVKLTDLTGNARLRLFNNSQTDVTPSTTSNSKQLSEALSTNLTTGTYYIQVDLDPSDVTATDANYKLTLSISTDAILSNLVWRNKATGAFSVVQTDGKTVQSNSAITFNGSPVSLPTTDWTSQFADFNGDGEDDILWRNQKDGTVSIWLMKGETILQAAVSPYKVFGDWQATLGDFNNDNHADIFWRNKQGGSTGIWLTNSAGLGFDTLTLLPGVSSDWDPALGDFNKDGKKDIFWRNSKSSEVAVWLMNGTQIITGGAAFLPSVSSAWKSQLGDFNKDGRTDIFWRNTQTGEAAVWLLSGTQIITGGAAFLPSVPIEWTAQVGDFDGNKADDLLWRNNRTGELVIWLLNGTQIATGGAAFLPSIQSRFTIEKPVDFNNDGKADLLLRDPASGDVVVWLLNGTSILDAAFLPSRSSSDQLDGVERRQFVSTTQSIGGGTELSAFNIGTLNTSGVYADSISSDVPDYFKFNLAIKSTLVLSSTDSTGQPLNSVKLDLYKAGVSGAPSTLVTYTGQVLDPGDYYIKASTDLDGINYRLNVEGKPQAVDFVGTSFTGPSQVLLTQGDSSTNPVSTISVNYSLKNDGTIPASNVKVSFYISRDQTFSLAGATPDYNVAPDQTFSLQPNEVKSVTGLTFSLPAWKDKFWVVDGSYYLLAVIDPTNAFDETSEGNNVSVLTLDVLQIPTINLRGKSLTVSGTTFAPTGTVNATFVTENNGFQAESNGSEVGFYLSTTPVFNTTDTSAWAFTPKALSPIGSKSNSGTQNVSLTLPPKNWAGWSSLSGPQKFYLGMIQNNDGAVNDVNQGDNQNRGQGIDWVEILVNV